MPVSIDIAALVIPIAAIDKVYPGGFEKYRADNSDMNYRLFDHDEFLVRIGAMDSEVLEAEIRFWENLGLIRFEMQGTKAFAKDLYLVSSWSKTRQECPWLTVDERTSTVCWKEQQE